MPGARQLFQLPSTSTVDALWSCSEMTVEPDSYGRRLRNFRSGVVTF